MAGADPVPVLRSVLDRLMDDDPERGQDPPVSQNHLLRAHRESVMRDVGELLNARRPSPGPPEHLPDLVPSLADYGVVDFLGLNLASVDAREKLRASIEETIRRYEPRFKRVDVSLFEEAEMEDGVEHGTLRLRIEALLHAEPAPITVSFDSIVNPLSGAFDMESRGS
jgi:type VI secretion system protein ImpF